MEVVSSVSKATHYNLNWNNDNNVTFNGTSKDDYLWNGGYLVKVNGGAGNNFIENNGSNVTIDAGDGNNSISNGEWKEEIGGVGNGFRTKIISGNGKDTI